MDQKPPNKHSNGKSSEPTNPITKKIMAEALDKHDAQNQEGIVKNLQPGYELGKGRYVFKEKLGEGGFGITFLAEDKNRGKQVVIKTLNEKMRNDPDFGYFRQKFNNEAVKLGQCNHPHIVKLMDEIIYDESGWPYLVMEYIAGKNLERYIKEDCGFLQQEEALHYALQIADALRVVHQMTLFHLDVNPRNIVIRNDKKEAVLIDFGTSRRADADLKSVINEFMSRSYAPIERYRQLEQGAYTDVYGLSATLYFMLAGRDPEPADTRERLIKRGRPDPLIVPIISSKNSDEKIEGRVEQAIIQGLALEPEDRPQSIQEWLNLLQTSTNYRQVEPDPTIIGDNNNPYIITNYWVLLGRAAFMGAAICLLVISTLKLITNDIRYVASLLLCLGFIFLAQYRLIPKYKSHLFISAIIPNLLIFLTIFMHIIPKQSFETLGELPVISKGLLSIATGFLASTVIAFLQFFTESDNEP